MKTPKKSPLFKKPQLVGTPFIESGTRDRFHELIDGVFDRKYLTNHGPLVRKFEDKISKIYNGVYCSAICNGTLAQMLLMKALGLKGEVIVPSFTFISTVHACIWQGLKVVFSDILEDSMTIDPLKAERLITPKTSAIIGVHLFGNMCDVERLSLICKKRNIKLICDAAHAFNGNPDVKLADKIGDGTFLSFHATKFLGTFEGGAVLANDIEIDRKIRKLRNFGFSNYDEVDEMGINGKMPESSAAMGLASLPMVRKRFGKEKKVWNAYAKNLEGIPGISILSPEKMGRVNFHYFVILVDSGQFGVSTEKLSGILWEENVFPRRYFYPGCHKMEYYRRNRRSIRVGSLDVTERMAGRVLCLPTNLENPHSDTKTIADIMRSVHFKAKERSVSDV